MCVDIVDIAAISSHLSKFEPAHVHNLPFKLSTENYTYSRLIQTSNQKSTVDELIFTIFIVWVSMIAHTTVSTTSSVIQKWIHFLGTFSK